MSSETFKLILVIALPALFFAWAIIEKFVDGKKFKLENSRQFVMSLETADSHNIKKIDDTHFSMEYYGKTYVYKMVRIVEKHYSTHYGHRHYDRKYLILEKINDEQPPHYSHMDEMKKPTK